MTKEIKDYIHYYLGQPCLIGDSKGVDYIRMVNETGLSVCTGTNKNGIPVWYKSNTCKPLLRPLSSMTEDEKDTINNEWGNPMGEHLTDALVEKNEHYVKLLFESFELFHYLLKQGFDLFGLLESGLAIDKTTQP